MLKDKNKRFDPLNAPHHLTLTHTTSGSLMALTHVRGFRSARKESRAKDDEISARERKTLVQESRIGCSARQTVQLDSFVPT